jgi:hypothetical protein
MCERVEDRHSVPMTCCRRVVMICKISNFDEILEKFIKFLIGKRRFIFKCVNVGNVTYAHFVTCKLCNRSVFPTCQCVVHMFVMFQFTLLHSLHSHETSLDLK